jgi:hypothetical protein
MDGQHDESLGDPMSEKNMGSGIDDFLKQEGIFEEAQSQAVNDMLAWQPELRVCSFCHKTEDLVAHMVSSPADYTPRAHICSECIAVCSRAL